MAKFARLIDSELVWSEESLPPALEALYFDSCNLMNEWIGSFSQKKKKKNTSHYNLYKTIFIYLLLFLYVIQELREKVDDDNCLKGEKQLQKL